eukprot:CAMPEP_0178732714 /NCGR_PEP_ID=MMETSP0744-20121128/410_1 /TAXON_ID=913974 /ORGANISM="Nitzschia punctata, Strain CCMP561" /LENGTH=507 /DNA_ID=CAMNT_0020384851 /DNA_START=76 /DNA_END=1600 /DNA_ORIENTATION=+
MVDQDVFQQEHTDSGMSLASAVLSAFLCALIDVRFGGIKAKSNKNLQHPLPPRCKEGFFQVLDRFNSIKFHDWILGVARTQAKIVEFNLWPLVPWNTHFFAVSDPRVARAILENPKTMKPREVYSLFDGIVGGVCFISEEGERYKHPRKSVLTGMSYSSMDDMQTKIDQVIQAWIDRNLGQNKGDVTGVDVGVEMQKCTLQSIGKIAFGYDFSEQEQAETLDKVVAAAFEFGIESEKNPIRKNRFLGPLFWPSKRKAVQDVRDMRELARKLLKIHRQKSPEEQSLVTILNALDAKGKYDRFDKDESMISDMLLLYFAGFDTTGYTVSFALLELAKNQHIQTKLREELLQADQMPEQAPNSPLLKRVVKETMRLWSVAAGGGARILPDDMVVTSDDGYGGERQMTLPKGSMIMMATYPIMRDKDTFDRPDEWLPSRWENATQEMKDAYMPFMVGRRSCPGQLLAVCESEIFLGRLVKDYEWSLVKETTPEYTITLKIKGTVLQAKKIA